jgi:flavin reductase (DIM6/NTAB) family NADH-FMN oxidoreductase RutF
MSSESSRRLTADEFRDVIGHFASGVTVITTSVDGQAYGTTASAVASLSLEPPSLLICMNLESATGQAVARAGRFAVNILGEDHGELALRFARKGGDKFAGVALTGGEHGQPLLAEALASLVCRVTERVAAGTHVVFIGEVEEATARPGAPLAYFRGRFGRLALDEDTVG